MQKYQLCACSPLNKNLYKWTITLNQTQQLRHVNINSTLRISATSMATSLYCPGWFMVGASMAAPSGICGPSGPPASLSMNASLGPSAPLAMTCSGGPCTPFTIWGWGGGGGIEGCCGIVYFISFGPYIIIADIWSFGPCHPHSYIWWRFCVVAHGVVRQEDLGGIESKSISLIQYKNCHVNPCSTFNALKH